MNQISKKVKTPSKPRIFNHEHGGVYIVDKKTGEAIKQGKDVKPNDSSK